MKKESEQTKEFKKKFNESFTDQDIKEHIEKTKPFTELKEKNKIKSHYITWKAVTTICIDVLT